ncbi:MFS transporter [Methylobrevis pamukkalensis]|uniref:Inner membrane protein YbjJ n=1 Tax=Methylobrevis pamukkalensis TaxID=1439726 RepID=A0A1E3H075_9HYPH|nr:MFS transporter [Methylobrevis pamukkalensis]ODN69684.1 Inner membrane protein YbjJ [Methylobrevis pamukkalensis]
MPLFVRFGLPFLLNAFLLSSWLTRIPDLQTGLGIDKATLGLALFAMPLGTVCALPLVGRVIERASERAASLIGALGGFLALVAIGGAPTWLLFTLSLFVLGLFNALMEVAMNVAAAGAEQRYRVHIMSRCHGFWSIGMVVGALVSGVLAEIGVSPLLHLGGICVVGILAAGILFRVAVVPGGPAVPPEAAAADAGGHATFSLPGRAILGVCLMTVGVTVAEGAMFDWSTLFLRRDLEAAPLVAGIGYALFAGAQATMRLCGDMIRARIAAEHIVLGSGIATVIGITGIALSPSAFVAWPFLMLTGVGVSMVYPIASMVVTLRPGRSPAANVAGLTLVVMMALLTAPPLIGLIGEAFGLRVAFLAVVPVALLTVILARQARADARVEVTA